jgi:hypothetical protein
MEKIYITDRQAFIEWKLKYTTDAGKFHAISCGEDEPTSYPCILLEYEEYNNRFLNYDTYYDFVYLTDFIHNWDYSK